MKLKNYLYDRSLFIFFQIMVMMFLFVVMNIFVKNSYVCILTVGLFIFGDIIYLALDYTKRRHYYNHILDNLEQMEKKHLIIDLIDSPEFADAEVLYEIIKITTKSMNDEIAWYKRENDDYRSYIESWIHEVKTPIACIDLICKNSKNDVSNKILVENKKIENYVEQVLFYAKSMNVSDDYRIKKIKLNDVVHMAVKNFSKQLILVNAEIDISLDDTYVYCDEKWLLFILGQIISNSIKYRKEKLKLRFSSYETENNVTLSVKDNGIGIRKGDILKVFNKGFTGNNGRTISKSTGMGLYICKMLCDKLYLDIDITSTENVGTEITIVFPLDNKCYEL